MFPAVTIFRMNAPPFPRRRPLFRHLIALQLLAAMATCAQADNSYTVDWVPGGSPGLQVTLTLNPEYTFELRKLEARGVYWGLAAQVRAPVCDGGFALAQDEHGYWLAPPGCGQVSWTVDTPVVQDGEFDVSSQASRLLLKAEWALLSEPSSLLRVVNGSTRHDTLRAGDAHTSVLGATPAAEGHWQLPASDNAPEFFIVGTPRIERRQVGDFSVRYVADDWTRVGRLGLLSAHEKALRYLGEVVYGAAEVPEKARSLMVVWVGVDAQHGRAGGAAGERSFLANYVIGDAPNARHHRAATFMILAHEQFHQLANARRGQLPVLPAWVNESIAQYYGLRAMHRAIDDEVAVARLTQRFIAPSRPIEHRFAEIEALFASDRPRALELAYHQGATFWSELDRTLQMVSGGKTTLDQYIPGLLQMTFPEDGRLPDAFLAQLREWKDPRLEHVISEYL